MPIWAPTLIRAIPQLRDRALYLPFSGEALPGGDILEDKSQLAQYYANIVENEITIPNATLIRSIVYHVCLDHGLSTDLARERAGSIYLTKPDEGAKNQCQAGCIYNAKEQGFVISLGMEYLFSGALNLRPDKKTAILDVYARVAHEAAHGAIFGFDFNPSIEDYGSIGTSETIGYRQGFHNRAIDSERLEKLLQYSYLAKRYDQTDEELKISPPEEFFAEWSVIEFGRSLLSPGLAQSESAQMYYTYFPIAYPFFAQALTDIEDALDTPDRISWQTWWEGELSFDKVKKWHAQNDRYQFFTTVGRLMTRKNLYNPQLTPEETAAYGLLAFHAWLHAGDARLYDDPRPVFTYLLSYPITPEILQRQTDEFVRWRTKLQHDAQSSRLPDAAESLFLQAGVPVSIVGTNIPTKTPEPVPLLMQAWLRPIAPHEQVLIVRQKQPVT